MTWTFNNPGILYTQLLVNRRSENWLNCSPRHCPHICTIPKASARSWLKFVPEIHRHRQKWKF